MSAPAIPTQLLPSHQFRARFLWVFSAALLFIPLLAFSKVDWSVLLSAVQSANTLFDQMVPPNFQVLWKDRQLYSSLGETLSMAFLGTVCGCSIAAVFALLAAQNTSPHGSVRLATRSLLGLLRSTPAFVVVLFFLVAVGIGPFAAMLSILVESIGIFGKLFADTIEQIDESITEAVGAIGASRLQVIRYGVLPQIIPAFTATLFYAFDVNLRTAIALGVFGGGGIGFQLTLASHVLHYRDMLAYAFFIIVLITSMERISDALRRKILATEVA